VETVGDLLRGWRTRRRLSQLELAIRAEVSARHISFVETGRTVPSSDMVLRLAEQLEVPLRDRNRLLVAAGHAPVFRERPPGDPDDARVRAALQRILLVYEPYPAVAVDHRWNVRLANGPFEALVEESALPRPLNLMRLGLDPRGLAVINRAQVRAYLLPRLRRQAARTGDPELHALYQELATEHEPQRPDPADIALPVRIRHRDVELWFISTITTFGAAFDVALEDVAIETYLPADETTTRYCQGLGR
jgi:transcriptional regulator with XRE-family HTH domain